MKRIQSFFKKVWSFHIFGSFAIIVVVMFVMSIQVSNRTQFANTELHQDVMDRWGTPITQAAPSVRFVQTGSVFTQLDKLPLASQTISLNAEMNYRKRGLVYFSGFDFRFEGDYSLVNQEEHDIDIVFVFPLGLRKNRVLLKDFTFEVNGQSAPLDSLHESNKLVWTGRLQPEERVAFTIRYAGRGLDKFVYTLDPSLPVRDFSMTSSVTGGRNYDYPRGVVPATSILHEEEESVSLVWQYDSLESGVPVGLILPSEESFSKIIITMTQRSLPTFALFFIGMHLLAFYYKHRLRAYESYLICASFAFFYVLLPYLTAFMNFYIAYGISLVTVGALLFCFLQRLISREAGLTAMGLFSAFLLMPTMAVVLQGYTGLIYTLEILSLLAVTMWLVTGKKARDLLEGFFTLPPPASKTNLTEPTLAGPSAE